MRGGFNRDAAENSATHTKTILRAKGDRERCKLCGKFESPGQPGKRRPNMSVVAPLTREQAAREVHDIFEKLAGRSGKVPNIFAAMAHRPEVLKAFLPLYVAIINQGTVEAKYKELAYLRASMVNGCEYCSRAHIASSKGAGVTAEQIAALPFYARSPLFNDKEKATILYADRVTRGAVTIRLPELEEIQKYYDAGQIVELTAAVCIANFTNRFNDALELIPDLGV
jgi:uncharacterized peroxidase-related enzyme